MRRIYLDHHATTPLLPEVRAAMEPFLGEAFGNPASEGYREGREASEALELARSRVASLVHARTSEVVFTSGATEADNHAIKGSAWASKNGRDHLVTCAIEHEAVLGPTLWLERHGVRRTILKVDPLGRVDPEDVRRALSPATFLVSIQMANGEIGTIQDVRALAAICREAGVPFHVDAAQAAGRIPLDFAAIGADVLSISAHKMHGPKGVGALLVRRGVRIDPLVHGGGQESGRRSGTPGVAGVVGFGAACEAARSDLDVEAARLAALRDRLWDGIRSRLPGVTRHGDPERCLPNNLNVTFEGLYAAALVQALRHIAVSSGSACSSSNPEPSHVLRAIGLRDEHADATLRFGLGRGNVSDEIDETVAALAREVPRLRSLSPAG